MKPRSSCDACHLRKTKCDLVEESAKARAQGRINADVSCSFCQSLHLTCKVSSAKSNNEKASTSKQTQMGKHKKGKRIRALLEEEEDRSTDLDDELNEENGGVSHIDQNGRDRLFPQLNLQPGGHKESIKDSQFTTWASAFNSPNASTPNPKVSSSSRHRSSCSLLSVRGLSKSMLQACIQGYFDTMEKWIPLTQGREEFLRRSDLLIRQSQGLLTEEEDEEVRKKVEKGPQKGPIAEIMLLAVAARGAIHSPYPFLFEPLVERFNEIVHSGDTLTEAGLDGLEAINIIHEAFFRTLHPKAKNGKLTTCLRMDPLGKGFPMELCLFHGVNDPASVTSTKDPGRCQWLFWVCYAVDAIRSASACRMYRLQEADIGWAFPTPPSEYRFIYIADIARHMCRKLFSAKSRCEGLSDEVILDLLKMISDWPKETKHPTEIIFSLSDENEVPKDFKLAENLFVSALWLRLSLSLWTSIQAKRGEGLLSSTLKQVERATLLGAERIELLAKTCIRFNLIECGSTLMISTLAAWFLYLTRKWDENCADNSLSQLDREQEEIKRFKTAKIMIDGIRSAKQTRGAIALADSLREVLMQRSDDREGIKVEDINHVSEQGQFPIPNKRQKRTSAPNTNGNGKKVVQRSSQQQNDVQSHREISENDGSNSFPSEEEQRQGALSASESPSTTMTPNQASSIDSSMGNNFIHPAYPNTIIRNQDQFQQLPLLNSYNGNNGHHSSSTNNNLLGTNVLAWDPDLLAFLDASLLGESF